MLIEQKEATSQETTGMLHYIMLYNSLLIHICSQRKNTIAHENVRRSRELLEGLTTSFEADPGVSITPLSSSPEASPDRRTQRRRSPSPFVSDDVPLFKRQRTSSVR